MAYRQFGRVAVRWGEDALWNMNLFLEIEDDK